MAAITSFPKSKSFDNSGESGVVNQNSTERDLLINFNAFLTDFLANIMPILTGNAVVTVGALGIGTTVTLATGAQVITINGVPVLLAAQTAQALGALGTIPASVWGILAVERVAAGTTTFLSGSANYTTGYASEAAAIAALPAQSATKVRVGYVTILASASTFVVGTDALAGGTGGNPATTTNYYNTVSIADSTRWTADQIGNMNGTLITQ